VPGPLDWNPQNFAREQMRTLVRRVFFSGETPSVKRVVFSAAEPQTDVGSICDQVGRVLALETSADIAIISRNSPPQAVPLRVHGACPSKTGIKGLFSQIEVNLWRVPLSDLRERPQDCGTGQYWTSLLAELHNDFEYVVIHGPAAGTSSESALLGQLADGIILVLEAHQTRKAIARKIIEMLQGSHTRILGTVLSERTFPVPERLYRRL